MTMTTTATLTCHEEVVRDGLFDACDRKACGFKKDPETGGLYPVCGRHGATATLEELFRMSEEARIRVAALERAAVASARRIADLEQACRNKDHRADALYAYRDRLWNEVNGTISPDGEVDVIALRDTLERHA